MLDLKCKGCNKLLAKIDTINGAIKCPRCHMIFEYKVFSNLFVNNLYDTTNLHKKVKSSNMPTESTRPSVRSR